MLNMILVMELKKSAGRKPKKKIHFLSNTIYQIPYNIPAKKCMNPIPNHIVSYWINIVTYKPSLSYFSSYLILYTGITCNFPMFNIGMNYWLVCISFSFVKLLTHSFQIKLPKNTQYVRIDWSPKFSNKIKYWKPI